MKGRRAREIHLLPERGEGREERCASLWLQCWQWAWDCSWAARMLITTKVLRPNPIKAGLFSDARTKSANIDVVVKNGTATLVGNVPDENTRYEAFKIAKETAGVVSVKRSDVSSAGAR